MKMKFKIKRKSKKKFKVKIKILIKFKIKIKVYLILMLKSICIINYLTNKKMEVIARVKRLKEQNLTNKAR